MPLTFAMSVLNVVEFSLWMALGWVFWSRKLHRRFPAMSNYLKIRVGCAPFLFGSLFLQAWLRGAYFNLFFFICYAEFLASTVAVFFVCVEIFRHALAGFSGLARVGTLVFRWAALISLVVSLATAPYAQPIRAWLPDIALRLMRSAGVIELCLLGFLCLSMHSIQLSIRSMSFGISLGFGILSFDDVMVGTLLSSASTSLNTPLQFLYESLTILALLLWLTYWILPEPEREPVVIPVSSALYRWNEIASALGHTGTKVVVQQTTNTVFLSDVEKVADKVLTRTFGKE